MVGRIALRPGSELKMVRAMLVLGLAVPQGRVVGMVRVTFRLDRVLAMVCAVLLPGLDQRRVQRGV